MWYSTRCTVAVRTWCRSKLVDAVTVESYLRTWQQVEGVERLVEGGDCRWITILGPWMLLSAYIVSVEGCWAGWRGVETAQPRVHVPDAARHRSRPGVEAISERRPPLRRSQPDTVDGQVERVAVQSEVSKVVQRTGVDVGARADQLVQFRVAVGRWSGGAGRSRAAGRDLVALPPRVVVVVVDVERLVSGAAETSTEDRRPADVQYVRQRFVVGVHVVQEPIGIRYVVGVWTLAGDRWAGWPPTNLLRRLATSTRGRRRRSLAEEITVDDSAELRIDSPVAALARVRLLTLDTLEALVERQIVTNGVLQHPPVRC